jgi:hypothetical protein
LRFLQRPRKDRSFLFRFLQCLLRTSHHFACGIVFRLRIGGTG